MMDFCLTDTISMNFGYSKDDENDAPTASDIRAADIDMRVYSWKYW